MDIEEVRKAAEWWRASKTMLREMGSMDRFKVEQLAQWGGWASEELARRDQEAAEQALPITEEWLRSFGFRAHHFMDTHLISGDGVVICDTCGMEFTVCNGRPSIKTRGQLRDLLAVLKGGE